MNVRDSQQTIEKETELKELRSRLAKLRRENRELFKQNRIKESLYLSILDAIPINIFLEDPEGHTIYANKQTCLSNGMSLDELTGMTVFDLFPQEIAEVNRAIDLKVWKNRELVTTEVKAGFKGEEHYMFTGKTIINIAESNQDYLLGFGLDIGDRVRAEQLLRESEEKFRGVIEQAGDCFFLIELDGRLTDVNPTACELLEYRQDELLQLKAGQIFSKLPEKLTSAFVNFEGSLLTKSQQEIPVDISIRPIQIGEKQMYFAFCRDIRSKKNDEAKIEYMAYHDALTDLPNRWYIRSYLEEYIQNRETAHVPLGFILLDLDHFKVINDSLGHEAGDLLLLEAAKRLKRITREEGIFLARFGGDEFILLVPRLTGVEEASRISEKIIQVLHEPFYIDGQKVKISASIGISMYPEHGDNLNTLFKNADIAMYDSKDHGRNCLSLYTPMMKQLANERLDLEILLRKAAEENDFILHYQPKVCLVTGETVGVEALIRWRYKGGNRILYPDSFIHVAEETGLINAIGEWVLLEACRQCKEWHDAGFNQLTVSVNLSPNQFQKPNLDSFIVSVLEETGLPPWALELELTENTLMKDPEKAAVILKRLKDLGITISIDDFGKGFSSLSYIKLFPIDTLKIDKSFIMNLETDQVNASIAAAVVSLAHNLGLKVVAEGVETKEQKEFLHERSCDFAQGYHISKPLDANDLYRFLKSNERLVLMG